MIKELDENEVYVNFEKELKKALETYEQIKDIEYKQLDMFIGENVWQNNLKYNRMLLTTKEKFFEDLQKGVTPEEYERRIIKLWRNIDHSYLNKNIEEVKKMVLQKNFKNKEIYSQKKFITTSPKLKDSYRLYDEKFYEIYEIHKEIDYKALEDRYVLQHIMEYQSMYAKLQNVEDKNEYLKSYVRPYNKLDNNIPYYHKDGTIKCWNNIATYLSMLYNTDLTRTAWNRTYYDSQLLEMDVVYLSAHPFACPHCAEYQGKLYSYSGTVYPSVNTAIEGGVGHPNCKHEWLLYWDKSQIQKDKYDSEEWVEAYKIDQKIKNIDLQKSRLLADRRIYKNLGDMGSVDLLTEKIKKLRDEKSSLKSDLETLNINY